MTSEALKQIDRETGPATSQQSRDQVKSKEKLKPDLFTSPVFLGFELA
jgi:hypothetical protein